MNKEEKRSMRDIVTVACYGQYFDLTEKEEQDVRHNQIASTDL
jgi:hypothetical protein